ncbi:MAG TPA: DUF5671 domain-containing protein [Candidatus Peribacterales bacterium]|nr:DUF5671 domain-containing protein [Candidatus Peribacterales bacterium]
MQNHLQEFITHARKKGMDHATIRMLLLSSGWKERDIAQALSAEGLDMQVPVPPDAGGARDAFFHLVGFAALYTFVISSITLFFQYWNNLLPDAATDYTYMTKDFSGIRWGMAAVLVSFPLLVWMSKILLGEMRKHPEKSWGGIRRWLTYITLFIAACAMMADVITLVFSLLQGELSVRFVLKFFTVFFFAGLTFVYYFLSLKIAPGTKTEKDLNRGFLVAASSIAGIAFVWGIVLSGSPATQRLHRFDDKRVENLRSIHQEIMNIVYNGEPYRMDIVPRKAVPATLEEVQSAALYTRPEIVDPETGAPYEYRVVSRTAYELCATFAFDRNETYDILWNHSSGRFCYSMDVKDPKVRQ